MADRDVFDGRWAHVVFSGRVTRSEDAGRYDQRNDWKLTDTISKENTHRRADEEGIRNSPQNGKSKGSLYTLVRSSPLAVVVLGMACGGLVPVSLNRCYTPLLSLRRSTLVYCLLAYSISTCSYILICNDQVGIVTDSSVDWDLRLFSLEAILVLLSQAVCPWLWVCTPGISELLWRFAEYEDAFTAATKFSLRDRWAPRARMLRRVIIFSYFFFGVVFLAAAYTAQNATEGMQGFMPPGSGYTYFPAVFLSNITSLMLFLFTVTHFGQLREAATALGDHLALLRAGDTAGMRQAHSLWVSLRALFNERPSFYLLDVFVFGHIFLMLLFGTYMSYAQSVQGMLTGASGQLVWTMVVGLQLYRMVDVAHKAVSAMCGPVVVALDRLSMDTSDPKFFRAVSLFYLSVTSQPPALSLSGFTHLNRHLFTSIVSLSVTYLVIMMQFRTEMSHPT